MISSFSFTVNLQEIKSTRQVQGKLPLLNITALITLYLSAALFCFRSKGNTLKCGFAIICEIHIFKFKLYWCRQTGRRSPGKKSLWTIVFSGVDLGTLHGSLWNWTSIAKSSWGLSVCGRECGDFLTRDFVCCVEVYTHTHTHTYIYIYIWLYLCNHKAFSRSYMGVLGSSYPLIAL